MVKWLMVDGVDGGEEFKWKHSEVMAMTEISMEEPGAEEPLILERLSDLQDQHEYLAHYPDVRGRAVVNPLGDEVGVVDDLYVNPRDRRVEMAAITFTDAVGYGGKRVLVPVEEIQLLDDRVRILTHEEHIRMAPEFHEGAPSFEPYYEYWSSRLVGPTEEPSEGFIRPPGRLELEDEEAEELEEQPQR
jgi:sporulation protein YlmC with PRC-barrel domain